MKINIVGGSGAMGNLHKKIFEDAGHEVIISGRDTNISPEEAAEKSDLTIISVPISATEEVIKKVAPHCKAIMDFTGIKISPIKLMIEHSPENCEVGGLHPLYGNVSSIKNRTVVYVPTEKSGKKCEEIIDTFEKAGAKIKKMDAKSHDLLVGVISQNARRELLNTFALLMKKNNLTAKDIYEIAPPPTKIILDLIARQVDEKNDNLYFEMQEHNPFKEEIEKEIKEIFSEKKNSKEIHKMIRNLFGDELKPAQERAKKIVEYDFGE